MKDQIQTDVLIVGAGAAGLTLAVDLARRGISTRLIDKLPAPFAGSRGKGIQPRSQEVFEDLGVLDRLVAIGGLYPPERKFEPDGTFEDDQIMDHADATPGEPYHLRLMVPQFLTEQVLRERLAELGGAPEFGCEVLCFEQDQHGVTAEVLTAAGLQMFSAKYLVGADGGRSFIRKTLGIDFPGKTLGVRAVVADVTIDGLSRDYWRHWNHGDMSRHMSLCPLGGTEMFQLQAPVPVEGEIDVSAAGLTRMIKERTGEAIIVQAVHWGSPYNMNARLADSYRVGRIFIAGDAAHIHPPTGGQGLNTSVQDAYNLGWKLAAVLSGAPDALLDTYEEERRPIAAAMLGLATKLLDAARAGSIRRGREVHQLDIGYPDSSLALEAPRRETGVLAGQRAPDVAMQGAAGQPRRLFDLTTGGHWTAIGYETARAATPVPGAQLRVYRIGEDGDIRDAMGHFSAAYAIKPGSWVLIRPDGYVGAIVDADHVAELYQYLSVVGAHPPG